MIVFQDNEHEAAYYEILNKMKSSDCYRQSAAYLIALDRECRRHIDDIFNFEDNCIKPEGLNKPWQTGTSRKSTRLMFNLWNGYTLEEDDEDENLLIVSGHYSVSDIFCCYYAPYYYEAIKLRYPEYTNEKKIL